MGPFEEEIFIGLVGLAIVSLVIYASVNNSPWFVKMLDKLRYKPESELLPKPEEKENGEQAKEEEENAKPQ